VANKILDLFASSAAMDITLASLASSTTGVGRQTALITNSNGEQAVKIFVMLKQGTSPTGGKNAFIHALYGDGDGHVTDGAGSADAALTILNAERLARPMKNKSSPATGEILYQECIIYHPGPEWGIALYQDTETNLDATEANHYIRYAYFSPEIQ
jgi:hypothetical protein